MANINVQNWTWACAANPLRVSLPQKGAKMSHDHTESHVLKLQGAALPIRRRCEQLGYLEESSAALRPREWDLFPY